MRVPIVRRLFLIQFETFFQIPRRIYLLFGRNKQKLNQEKTKNKKKLVKIKRKKIAFINHTLRSLIEFRYAKEFVSVALDVV